TPGGIGGYPATVFLFGRVGVAPACAAALTAADQALDLLFFFAVLPLAALGSLNGHHLHLDDGLVARVWSVVALLAIGVLVIGGLGLAPANTAWCRVRLRESRFHRRVARLRMLWQESRAHLRSLAGAPAAFVCAILAATSLQWFARLAALGIALAWLGHAVPAAVVFLAQTVALHAGQWTGIPGGVGGTDLILARALEPWAPLATVATALMAWRIATFHLTLVAGGLAFAGLATRQPPSVSRLRRSTAGNPAIACPASSSSLPRK
ncbi:MAG: lysylphosphatidylglycerol synthase domain-containing protein, partial [Rhodanobacteraceae bacterium]